MWAAGFVLVCFIGVNAFQVWAAHTYFLPLGGFPLPWYDRYTGIVSLNYKAALLNYLIAISVAGHVALGVFALFNAKAIIRWIRQGGKFE